MILFKHIQMSLYLCLLIALSPLKAEEQTVATIANDDNPNVVKFILNLSDNTHSVVNFYKDTYLKSVLILRERLETKDLEGNGINLEVRDGRVILALKSDNFNSIYGGSITIDTLYNGAIDLRRNYYIELVREQDNWSLQSNRKKIRNLFIETNKLPILGVVGIKNIYLY